MGELPQVGGCKIMIRNVDAFVAPLGENNIFKKVFLMLDQPNCISWMWSPVYSYKFEAWVTFTFIFWD